MEDKLLKVVEFAARADIAPSTIYAMVAATRNNTAKRRIKFVERRRGVRSLVLIPESELKKFEPIIHEG